MANVAMQKLEHKMTVALAEYNQALAPAADLYRQRTGAADASEQSNRQALAAFQIEFEVALAAHTRAVEAACIEYHQTGA